MFFYKTVHCAKKLFPCDTTPRHIKNLFEHSAIIYNPNIFAKTLLGTEVQIRKQHLGLVTKII